MKNLAQDLERFSDQWISNPAARLDFARLIERTLYDAARDFGAVRQWIAEEKRAAKSIGIK